MTGERFQTFAPPEYRKQWLVNIETILQPTEKRREQHLLKKKWCKEIVSD